MQHKLQLSLEMLPADDLGSLCKHPAAGLGAESHNPEGLSPRICDGLLYHRVSLTLISLLSPRPCFLPLHVTASISGPWLTIQIYTF